MGSRWWLLSAQPSEWFLRLRRKSMGVWWVSLLVRVVNRRSFRILDGGSWTLVSKRWFEPPAFEIARFCFHRTGSEGAGFRSLSIPGDLWWDIEHEPEVKRELVAEEGAEGAKHVAEEELVAEEKLVAEEALIAPIGPMSRSRRRQALGLTNSPYINTSRITKSKPKTSKQTRVKDTHSSNNETTSHSRPKDGSETTCQHKLILVLRTTSCLLHVFLALITLATDHIMPLAHVPGTNHSCYGSHRASCTCSWHFTLVGSSSILTYLQPASIGHHTTTRMSPRRTL
ncbi:hypothetical protein ISN45_Aa05g009680 [Arabidopsis thaliana x Arabidopsis arenosa]|uniref:Uncharacterized protein n=1 Tax=Arabidopsis thaliana x Arabidopsis arenosa TaxID=1240361 RepID=A0A8T1ZMI8_9BRAS|nr:hypothetical protein ISN45_Aa05g009680 [Arabidopsis thaliana x Arabidopsis arenosa]